MKFQVNQYAYLKFGDIEYLEYIVTDFMPAGESYMYTLYDYVTKTHKEISEDNLYTYTEIKFKPEKDQVTVDFYEYCPYLH